MGIGNRKNPRDPKDSTEHTLDGTNKAGSGGYLSIDTSNENVAKGPTNKERKYSSNNGAAAENATSQRVSILANKPKADTQPAAQAQLENRRKYQRRK